MHAQIFWVAGFMVVHPSVCGWQALQEVQERMRRSEADADHVGRSFADLQQVRHVAESAFSGA